MKKVLLIILFFIISSLVSGQAVKTLDSNGIPKYISSDNPMPISGTVTGVSTATRQDTLLALTKLIYYRLFMPTVAADPVTFGTPKTTLEGMFSAVSYPTEFYGGTDTVTTRIDTISFTGHDSYVEGYIKADDSVEVSIDPAFTSGHTFPIVVTTEVPIKWAINQQWTKLYIRRYGVLGTPRFYFRLSAL
jgi:hypothetical protein